MIHAHRRWAPVLFLSAALGSTTAVAAALNGKPPAGLDLSGTQWRIDPSRSDDPDAVIEKASREMDEDRRDPGDMTRDRSRDTGPLGSGRDHDGTWGGGPPDRTARTGNTPPSRTPTGVDPTGSQSMSIQLGSLARSPYLTQFGRNPDELAFLAVNEELKVTADQLETACAPGGKAPISDSYGDGERKCGWSGRAWVVETTRGKNLTRIDRYELSKDGKTLKYITTASGKGMPKIKISRTYTPAPAKG